MVNVLVNFLGVAHLLQQASQDANPTHPQDLEWKTGIGGTSTLTRSGVTALALGCVSQGYASAGMHHGWLLNNESISMESSNVATRIGKGNFVNLVGVQPDFALAAFQNVGREAFLEFQGDCQVVDGE